jgi:hypothetical protein
VHGQQVGDRSVAGRRHACRETRGHIIAQPGDLQPIALRQIRRIDEVILAGIMSINASRSSA